MVPELGDWNADEGSEEEEGDRPGGQERDAVEGDELYHPQGKDSPVLEKDGDLDQTHEQVVHNDGAVKGLSPRVSMMSFEERIMLNTRIRSAQLVLPLQVAKIVCRFVCKLLRRFNAA